LEIAAAQVGRVVVLVVYVFTIPFVNPAFTHEFTAGLVTLCPTLLLFWFPVILRLSELSSFGGHGFT
jgi:hypothetical protein